MYNNGGLVEKSKLYISWAIIFKLREGASMSTFLGRSVGLSVGPSVCLSKNLKSFKHWDFDVMVETKVACIYE